MHRMAADALIDANCSVSDTSEYYSDIINYKVAFLFGTVSQDMINYCL